ncbi:amidohydrolase family protein [Nocardioides flavescens]|uniref:Amidohydrolase n=1 Tax=Nocardioides flavescens TaxID=2691959 RepID=A0A6L7EXN4_9ACTN|nr:amidohydrolase family protein [Nocardioides flavescens]MXG90626.1 amidohydrolase [Nocardioides flavescens]
MTHATDVHQHIWPEELVDRLRARTRPPYLRGWVLHTEGEPPYVVDPTAHDAQARVDVDHEAGVGAACVSLSAPLGIEALPVRDAAPLVRAWHRGVAALPEHFRAWASVPAVDADLDDLAGLLRDPRFVGLQLPATQLLTPGAWERTGSLLAVAEAADVPVLVHPGPVPRSVGDRDVPGWWPAVTGYTAQLNAAWWGWHAAAVRADFPALRVVFAAAAGLAPVHHERHVIRGGTAGPVDAGLFVDTSGYGPRALDAVVRVLGIDALVLGSDRPYAEPVAELFGEAATRAVHITNPARLLGEQARDTEDGPRAGLRKEAA